MDSRRFLENYPYQSCYHFYDDTTYVSVISRYYCRPTLEVVFPNEYWTAEDLYQWSMNSRAMSITAEFNNAMDTSEGYEFFSTQDEDYRTTSTMVQFEIELLYTSIVDWDTSKTAYQNCRDYRRSKIDEHTDLTHCIFPTSIGGHSMGGRARKTGTPYGRVSWAQKSTLPGGEHSLHRINAHLLALNNGARTVFNDEDDYYPSLMIASNQHNAHLRGLYFYDTARRYDNGEQVNNVEELMTYMPILDTTPDEQNGSKDWCC